MFLLVPAYPGCPGPKAVKRLCVYVCVYMWTEQDVSSFRQMLAGFAAQYRPNVVTDQS